MTSGYDWNFVDQVEITLGYILEWHLLADVSRSGQAGESVAKAAVSTRTALEHQTQSRTRCIQGAGTYHVDGRHSVDQVRHAREHERESRKSSGGRDQAMTTETPQSCCRAARLHSRNAPPLQDDEAEEVAGLSSKSSY